MTETVASPCVSICALDESDICVGCFRSGNEISHWGRMSASQQRDVLRRCGQRMQGMQVECLAEQEL